jgi:hypothetical protein
MEIEQNLEECTFAPDTSYTKHRNNSRSNNTVSSIKGTEKMINRLKSARE